MGKDGRWVIWSRDPTSKGEALTRPRAPVPLAGAWGVPEGSREGRAEGLGCLAEEFVLWVLSS